MTPATAVSRFAATVVPALIWIVYSAATVLAGFVALATLLRYMSR